MNRAGDAYSEAEVEAHRGAAFREFAVGRAWPHRTASLAVMAILPFDAVEPTNRDWEVSTRLAAVALWRQLRTLYDPEVVAAVARDVLRTYRETAIAAGEPYYSRRYDNLLDATEEGHSVGSIGGEAAAECGPGPVDSAGESSRHRTWPVPAATGAMLAAGDRAQAGAQAP